MHGYITIRVAVISFIGIMLCAVISDMAQIIRKYKKYYQKGTHFRGNKPFYLYNFSSEMYNKICLQNRVFFSPFAKENHFRFYSEKAKCFTLIQLTFRSFERIFFFLHSFFTHSFIVTVFYILVITILIKENENFKLIRKILKR